MLSTIKAARRAAGVSVTELAGRLGVTPSAVSQLERSESEGSIKIGSLREALAALGRELRLTSLPSSAAAPFAPHRIADRLAEILLQDDDPTYPLRLLTQAAKELADNADDIDPLEIEFSPVTLPMIEWDTLLRAVYREAIPGSRKPRWTKTKPLPAPWFVSRFPILQERAKTTTPAFLRRLNIFIDARSLQTA